MPRASRRPSPVHVGELRAYVVRGPRGEAWYWRLRYHEGGKPIEVGAIWATRREVEVHLAGLLAAGTYQRAPDGPGHVEIVDDLLLEWVSAQRERRDLRESRGAGGISSATYEVYRHHARQVTQVLGELAVDRLTLEALERGRDALLRAYSVRTTATSIRVLRMAWAWGRERGLVPDRSLPRLRLPEPRRRYNGRTPTAEEVELVLSHLEGWPALVVHLLWATGARVGEVAALRWGDLDLVQRTLQIEGKTGRRELPLTPRLAALLQPTGPVEPEQRVLPVAAGTVKPQVTEALSRACAAAGVPRWTPHGLRRLASTVLIGGGVDPRSYEAVMGHSYAMGLRTYAQVRSEGVQAAAAMLGPQEGQVLQGPWAAPAKGSGRA